jgi:hypothetical protein
MPQAGEEPARPYVMPAWQIEELVKQYLPYTERLIARRIFSGLPTYISADEIRSIAYEALTRAVQSKRQIHMKAHIKRRTTTAFLRSIQGERKYWADREELPQDDEE